MLPISDGNVQRSTPFDLMSTVCCPVQFAGENVRLKSARPICDATASFDDTTTGHSSAVI